MSDKGQYPNYTKNPDNSTSRKHTSPLKKKWAKDLNRYFSKEDTQMVNRSMKSCSIPLVTRENAN